MVIAFIAALIIFVINYLLNAPSSVQKNFVVNRLEFALGFGLITAVVILFSFNLIPKFFFSKKQIESWTIGKEFSFIILLFCFIILCNYYYLISIAQDKTQFSSWSAFLFIGFNGIIIGLFPTLFILWINYTVILKRNLREAQAYNIQLKKKLNAPPSITPAIKVELESHNLKEKILIDLDLLCFIKSEGNYIEVYSLQDNNIIKKTYRASIQSIQEQLHQYPYIARAHRSYLVNLQNIQYSKGNARNFQLYFDNNNWMVPVSRSKFKKISEQLNGNS